MNKYHDQVITKEGFILSVDMVRLTFKFKSESDIEKLFAQLQFADLGMHCNLKEEDIDPTRPRIIYDYYQRKGGGFGKYKTLFTIYTDEKKEDSFALGIGLMNNKNTMLEGFIEFNPNKCCGSALEWILLFLKWHCKYLMMKRYDIALDVPIRGDNIFIEKDQRKYELHRPNSDPQYDTEYLGVRNEQGRFKKYNKKKEYNDKHPYGEPIVDELTRLELTLESLSYDVCCKQFPSVKVPALLYPASEDDSPKDLLEWVNKYGEQAEQRAYEEQKKKEAYEKLKETEKVLVELLLTIKDIRERYEYLNRVGRVMKNKIAPFVKEDKMETIYIREEDFNLCMHKLCEYCHLGNTVLRGKKSVADDTIGKPIPANKKAKKEAEWCYIVDANGEIFEGYDPVHKRWESKEAKEKYMKSLAQ